MSNGFLLFGCALVALAASPARSAESPEPARAFAELVDREWQWRLREFPTFATAVGVHDYDDQLGDDSLAAYARRDAESAAFLAELDGVDRAALSPADQIDYDIFRAQL